MKSSEAFQLNFSTPSKNVTIQPLVSVPVLAQALNDFISFLMEGKKMMKLNVFLVFQPGFTLPGKKKKRKKEYIHLYKNMDTILAEYLNNKYCVEAS